MSLEFKFSALSDCGLLDAEHLLSYHTQHLRVRGGEREVREGERERERE